MKLTIKERIQILTTLLPEKGGIVDLMLIKSIKNKVEFSSLEIEKYNIRNNGELVTWSANVEVDIPITSSELEILKNSVVKLDEQKDITIDNLDVCLKIKDEVIS